MEKKDQLELSHDATIERRLRVYVAALALTACAVFAVLAVTTASPGNAWVVAALALVAALAERGRVRLSDTLEASISLVPTLFAAVLFGPLASMAVSGVSFIPELRRPYMKWAIYTSSRMLTGAAVGILAVWAKGAFDGRLAGLGLAALVGSIVAQTLDAMFAATTLKLRRNERIWNVVRTLGPLGLAFVPLYAPIVALLAFAYQEVSPLTLPLFFVPALAAQKLFALYQDQRRLTDELVSANTQLERANLSFASALVATLDARDRYTAGHSAAVAIYARDIAERMGLSEEQQRLAHLCGLVHDIGKIGLPAGLLEKPGALTLEERRLMETHSEIGERILANVDTYSEIASIVRHHHERVDGQGYPEGLPSEEIPLLSRIIGVADAYNAMTSDRPYRDAMPSRVARLRLAQAVESQFDTSVVAAFEAILAGASEEYRTGTSSDFYFNAQARLRAQPEAASARVA
jgi:putative nucleotidyltransferase with HDIG domain